MIETARVALVPILRGGFSDLHGVLDDTRDVIELRRDQIATDPRGVRVFRASIAPDNVASRAMLQQLGFVHVGEQLDEDDGLELVFERQNTTDEV